MELNRCKNLKETTVPKDEEEFRKFDYEETFDRPPFTAVSPVVELNAKGNPKKDSHGRILYVNEIRNEGRAKLSWLNKNGLNECCKPSEWMKALLPLKKTPEIDDNKTVTLEVWHRTQT